MSQSPAKKAKVDLAVDKYGRSGDGGAFAVKGDHAGGWVAGGTNTVLSGDTLRIDDQPVMEVWEKPYMEELGRIASAKGGDLLEIGFGLGLSARSVQSHPSITSHTIVEANADVFESLKKFAEEEKAAGRPTVHPKHGFWIDIVAQLKKEGKMFDAILYDPYPQNESEQHLHHMLFMNLAMPLLKSGGRFVYCNLTSIGKLKESHDTWEDLWTKSQVPYLTTKLCGFNPDKMSYTLFTFSDEVKRNRGQCEYYMHDQALCPLCIKD